jgi:plastocyanin
LIAAGETLNYSSVYLIPRPNNLQGNAIMNAGIGSELVVLNATVPSGMYIHFFGSTLINRIYEEADAGHVSNTEMQLVAPQNVAPGNYTVTIEGSSGSLSVNYSFMVQVVKYLVIAQYQTFAPRNLNVTAGSTVYWINLSTDKNMPYDVIFTTINVHSDTLSPNPAFDSFSYTFTTPGVYPYYCAYASTMKGTITVTS